MGLFGFGKKKKSSAEKLTEILKENGNADDIAREWSNSKEFKESGERIGKLVESGEFAEMFSEAVKESDKNALELTEENLLKAISDYTGCSVTMSTKLGEVCDFSMPMEDTIFTGEILNKFGVHGVEEFTGDMTVSQVMEKLKS